MKAKHYFIINIILYFIIINSCSRTPFELHKNAGGIMLTSPGMNMEITVMQPGIIRVFCYTADESPEKISLVVDDAYGDVPWDMEEDRKKWKIYTGRLIVSISKKNGSITYYTPDGKEILHEGVREFEKAVVMQDTTAHVRQWFLLDNTEAVYGLGQYQEGVMNWRGHNVKMVQGNKEAVVPFLVSTKGYGIYWDNYSYSVFHDDAEGAYFWSEVGDAIDYYFVYGENMDEVIKGYRHLTGEAPMYGKWAYGFWQSKERYESQEEILSVATEYRERKIPIDNIVLDWQYWGNKGWNAMAFDRRSFPDPEGMIDSLHAMNYHFMISLWPVLGEGTPVEREMREEGYLFPYHHQADGFIYDAFNKDARDIYWKYMEDAFFNIGTDAWWLDATEPEFSLTDDPDSMVEAAKKVGGHTEKGSWAKVLNAYSLMAAKGVYHNQRKTTEAKRVFILTRSAFAGQQEYAATTWSGDISATWDIFRKQIAAGMNFCMAGIPYWTTDIGAFFTSNKSASFVKGSGGNAYREFYTRWFQFGVFTPIFRSHGTNTPRETWQFGAPGEWAYDIQLKFNKLRYRLLPYIYSLAWKVTNEGYTIMRGLPMDFTDDRKTHHINDQYMFGDAFMVNPVTTCMYYRPDVNLNLIPMEQLYDDEGEKGGLTGRYYKGPDFDELAFERFDSVIDFDWKQGSPAGLAADYYSIRWTGKLLPEDDGIYRFFTVSDDGVRLWIDESLLIDDWNKHAPVMNEGSMVLEAGKQYDIRLEYYEDVGDAAVRLGWQPPMEKERAEMLAEKTRDVYLPEGIDWYDFWTGRKYEGGQTITAAAPIDILPLFVRAGAIVPMGKHKQYATEKQEDTIEIRIYPGADGEFMLYEDENDNYNYENGLYSVIAFIWDDELKKLTIRRQKSKYPGMLKERVFNIVLVGENTGAGIAPFEHPQKTILYTGSEKVVFLD